MTAPLDMVDIKAALIRLSDAKPLRGEGWTLVQKVDLDRLDSVLMWADKRIRDLEEAVEYAICPQDSNGDGDCGQGACPLCSRKAGRR